MTSSLPQPRIAVPTNNAFDSAYTVQPGATELDGVVSILNNGFDSCSGALLWTGRHILTAAHCFNNPDDSANLDPDPSRYAVAFDLFAGRIEIPVASITVHPDWRSGLSSDNDLAIIELAEEAPDDAERYDIYRGDDEVGETIVRVGYGAPGTGESGELSGQPAVKRFGENRYDSLGNILVDRFGTALPNTQLVYDFDNGNPENDALGIEYGIADLGLGDREVGSSRGDSGGPSFIDGRIAGLVSYGFSPLTAGVDVTFGNDTSFGEIFVDTRVSAYAAFIDATVGGVPATPLPPAETPAPPPVETPAAPATPPSADLPPIAPNPNEFLVGTDGADELNGGPGDDIIVGLAGDDLLLGGEGADLLEGRPGNDVIYGNQAADMLYGNQGNDILLGGQGDDLITGGFGADVLSGDLGKDYLAGAEEGDIFILKAEPSAADPNLPVTDPNLADVVMDFGNGEDFIGLTGGLTEADLSLTRQTIDNLPSTVVRQLSTGAVLGVLSNVLPSAAAGRFVPVDF